MIKILIVVILNQVVDGSLLKYKNEHWLGIDLKSMNPNPLNEEYFTQKVSHFDPEITDTFQQRYFVNDTFYQRGAPLFVLLGGESPEDQKTIGNGLFVLNEYAREHNGLIIDIECRFFGKSVPYGSLDLKYLQYHTTPQILADYASLIDFIVQKYGCKGVITFGGSYAGSLSSWLHMKYPNIISGSLASSAPVLALVNFTEYLDHVIEVMSSTPQYKKCVISFGKAMEAASEMLSSPETKMELGRMFNVCEPAFAGKKDGERFMSEIYYFLMQCVQYGFYDRLNETCDVFLNKNSSSDLLRGLAGYMKENVRKGECMEVSYEKLVNQLKRTTVWPENELASERSWRWQKCNEFGFFFETSSSSGVFPNSMTFEYYMGICKEVFGITTGPKVNETNLMFGGIDPVNPNVFFTRGSVDPWSVLAADMNDPKLLTFLIEGGTHCSDLLKWTEGHPKGILIAQSKTKEYISEWLKKSL